MKWNDLPMAERAKYIQLGVKNGITNLDEIKNYYNSFTKEGYNEWKEKIKKHKGINIDNDPTYDYEGYYNNNTNEAWDMLNKDSNAHFTDQYKTVYHPSFSNESIYSGYRNKFNPEGITGGTWIDDNNYIMSQSQFDNDWDTDATLDYFNSAEDSPVNLYAPDGATVLKGITVTPNKFGGGGKKNYRIARLNNSGKPVIDYSIPAFNSEEEMDSYLKNNNLEQIFVEELPELVVKHPDLIKKEQEQEANWTDKDKERYARMMESTGWKADTDFADKAIAAEQRARNINQGTVLGQLASGLNVISPSQQFGAIVDWAQGEKGYWEGIGGGNSGFFTDEYANEHPIWTLVGNGAADMTTGLLGIDAVNMATTGTRSSLMSGIQTVRNSAPALSRYLTKGRNYLRSKNPWSKRYSTDRFNSILYKNTEPDYLKHFKREHSTQLSRDVAEAMAMHGLAENNIYHTKLLQELGEGDINYYPEAGTYMNDDAFARYYRIIPKWERWKYPKPITLSKEEGRIREVFPEYYVYARQRGLPVDDENTFAEFLDRMSTSVRGTTLKKKGLAEEYLTTAGNTPSGKPGGDRLYTNSGLYTSNSEEIADRFSKNITGVSSNPYGATAKLYHQFDIDNTLPISGRLQQLRDQINDVTVSSPKDNTLKALGKDFNLGVPDYNSNPEIHAVEGPYMGRESKERVYIGHSSKDKVADIKGDLSITSDVADRRHRWSPGEVSDEEGLFIPSYASYTKENLKKYTDRIIENNPQWTKEFKEDLQRRIVRIANIHRRKRLGRTLQITSPLLAGLIGGGIALHNYTTEQIDKLSRELYSELEYYRNNGYKQDLSELKYELGMDDSSDEEVIKEAEKIYKELSTEMKK